MTRRVILDTGPLVAFLNPHDRHHGWAREQWASIRPPFLTCEAVVTEACFLAHRFASRAEEAVIAMIERGVLDLSFRLADEVAAVTRMMRKYHDLPMSLADACLVQISRRHPGSIVLTLDADFRIYRSGTRQSIPVWMPDN